MLSVRTGGQADLNINYNLANSRSQLSHLSGVGVWINSHLKDDNRCVLALLTDSRCLLLEQLLIFLWVKSIRVVKTRKWLILTRRPSWYLYFGSHWILCRNWTEKFHPPCTHITVAANFYACPSRSHWLDICPMLDSIWLSWAGFREKMD